MRGRSPFQARKITLALLTLTVASTSVLGLFFFAPRPAQAQWVVTDPGATAAVLSLQVPEGTQAATVVKQSAWDVIKISLTNAAALALLNGVNYFAQKVAYDTANYIASGGKGQKPLFVTEGLGSYITTTAKDAAGEVLGTLAQDPSLLSKYGINLCAPTNPRIALNIKLGFLGSLPSLTGTEAPKPKCSWDSISNNWDQFSQLDSKTVLDQVGVMFTPGQSSLGAAIEINNAAINLINKRQQEALGKYIADSGFKDLTAKISGKVLTPADTIKQQLNISVENGWKKDDKTVAITGSAFGNAAFGILPAALQTFAGTLSEKLMRKIFEKGLISINDLLGGDDVADQTLSFDAAPPQGGRAAAELANASLLTPKILTISNYNVLTDFAACPTGNKGVNNCVIDSQFFNAVNRATQGAALTVKQAVSQGFLNRDWALLPLAHRSNRGTTCYKEAYCYTNLVKLRIARILPVGWELAANSQFNDLNRPVTLGEAMDRFNDCPRKADGSIDEAKLPDPLHPWCHLVDPEWVLKYPEAICRQSAPGPQLVAPEAAVRQSTCVDVATCVGQDVSGNCTGGYGYCVREKNVWKFDADACPAYYASCTTYKRADNATFSYLSNTLDSGSCNSQNAGCRQYSLSANAVPNAGFEDLISDLPRDWTLSAGAKLHRAGTLSARGTNAVGVYAGNGANVIVGSLQAGSEYQLSGAALQEKSGVNAVGTIRLSFLKADGSPVAPSDLTTTCVSPDGGLSVTLGISTTYLGYLTASCRVKTPTDTAYARLDISSDAPASSNRTWFDELGVFGGSYSISPYDSILLNAKTQTCPSDQAGCTEFVRLASGTLNLVRNPSFEREDGDSPESWTVPSGQYEANSLKSNDGVSSVSLSASPVTQDVKGLLADAAYSFTAYSKLDAGGVAASPTARIQLFDNSRPVPQPIAPASVLGCVLSGTAMTVPLGAGSDFVRNTCQFNTPTDVGFARISFSAAGNSDELVDSVQLELSVEPTSFHEEYGTAERIQLKKAPEGLNCTGQDRSPECDKYAPSCRREEVGCDSYAPKEGGTAIPAVTTDADSCPRECVGYDTFRQEPTRFNDARFPLFFIPSTGGSCSASEAGCSEFTNIERLGQGGESREYLTYLRLCAKRGPQTGTYYTWEGDDTRGFQLRTWSLLKSNIASAPATGFLGADPTGGNAPCTKLSYDVSGQAVCADDATSVQESSCDKDTIPFNPDCREFYDEAGNIHYRYYSMTIVSNDECKEYRITKSTEAECGAHGGFWRNGECRYFSYAPENQSCRPAANGCRAYSGNASRNVRSVVSNGFEGGSTEGWLAAIGGSATTDVVNSNESITAGGHSLKVSRATVERDVSTAVRRDKAYLLTFWARGDGDLSIALPHAGDHPFTYNRVANADAPAALTTEWRPYQLGPVNVILDPTRDAANPALDEKMVIAHSGSSNPFFIDNIELKEVVQNQYVIEDSWVTPASCDQTPAGDPSPQYMLGCRDYKNHTNATVSLKSFDRLCRPEAVGCEALYDTRNSESPFAQTFGAVCSIAGACAPGAGVTCPCAIGGKTVCQVVRGATSCRYDVNDEVPASGISPTGDTVRVAADGIMYLVNDPRFRCDAANIGCTAVGDKILKADRSAVESWSTRTVKNLPSDYANILCKKNEEYCQAYTSSDGSPAYFKDPERHVCEFRQDNGAYSGWFRKGTDEPCYGDFLQAGTQYGVWKNSDAAYDGWVGLCEAQYNMCKEFIDPEDTASGYPNGAPYYAIKNDRLDLTTCSNKVSKLRSPAAANDASSCVLFWQTDNLVKTYDAAATYAASDAKDGALVTPVNSASDTANVIIKVKRDRQCGQWLDCRSSETVFNASTGQYQNVCTSYGLCAQFERDGNISRCVKYVNSDYSGETLSNAVYAKRDIGWKGMDFSGYAIPNRYPVNEVVTVNVGTSIAHPDERLVLSLGSCSGAYGSACGPADDQGTCLGPAGARTCVRPIDDGRRVTAEAQLSQPQSQQGYPGSACRAYPQESAPFPSSVADPSGWNTSAAELNDGNPVLISPSPAFAGANVCQRRLVNGVETSSCECNYVIAKYGTAATKYFPAENVDIPQGYCSSGAYEGYECDPLASGTRSKSNLSCCSQPADPSDILGSVGGCSDGAQCARISKLDRVVGYEGQCLERDYTTPINGRADEYACLSWRPVGLIGGSRDIYNQNQSAGYFAAPDRRFYCVGEQQRWMLPFGITTSDTNGDGIVDPYDQPTTNFFGPGEVSSKVDHYASHGGNCSNDADSLAAGGGWCIYPGISEPVAVAEGSSVKKYGLTGKAIGILGCYEVSDNTKGTPPSIIWPYIGPPIYRAQLDGIYFQITSDIYYFDDANAGDDGGDYTDDKKGLPKIAIPDPNDYNDENIGRDHPELLAAIPTNPNQDVMQDCNDDGEDNIDPTEDDSQDNLSAGTFPLQDADPSTPGHQFKTGTRGLYYLQESNNWQGDFSDNEGAINLIAKFDKSGKLSSLELHAVDNSDEGTFGILSMGFVYKPGCQKIVQVDEPGEFGLTKTFTDSVNAYRDFTGGFSASDVFNEAWILENSCQPYGAVGSVSLAPTNSLDAPNQPWSYVAARLVSDAEQCTVTDYTRGANYRLESPNALETSGASSLSGLTAIERWSQSVRRIFRQVFGAWDYQKLTAQALLGDYQRASSSLFDETDNVDGADLLRRGHSIFWLPPRIAALDSTSCDSSGHCAMGKMRTMTVNGRDEGVVLGADGSMTVAAKFYGWASHDSMPILRRTILWGDDTLDEPPAKGWYKNSKAYCSPDSSDGNAIGECRDFVGITCDSDADCDKYGAGGCNKSAGNHFGNTPGACTTAPFEFGHTYTCSLAQLQAMPLCTGPDEAAANAPCYRLIGGSPTCVYRPKAQIVDNWGWCNCTGTGCAVSGGAHGDDCDFRSPNPAARPWTEFAGEIRLQSSVEDAQAFVPGGGGSGSSSTAGTAIPDSFTTSAGRFYSTGSADSVTFNDILVGSVSDRIVVVVDQPLHGTLANTCDPTGCHQITSWGGLNYIANTGYHGTDTFSYKIIQGGASSNVAQVTMTIP